MSYKSIATIAKIMYTLYAIGIGGFLYFKRILMEAVTVFSTLKSTIF